MRYDSRMNSLEQSAERFIKLPPLFQEAIRSFDYDKKMSGITQKHSLHIDQAFQLEKIVADVVFGDIHSNDMVKKMQQELHTTKELANEVAIDVNGIILVPLRELIKSMQSSDKTDIEADEVLDK